MILDIPDDISTMSVHQLAEWFVPNFEAIMAVKSTLWRVDRRLTAALQEIGPLKVGEQRLELGSDGYTWNDAEVEQAMPALVTQKSVTFTGTLAEIERTLSLVVEEQPTLAFEVDRKVDHFAANRVIKNGGAAAETLLTMRKPKPRLTVR